MNTKTIVLDTYLARTAAIHAKLEQLQRLDHRDGYISVMLCMKWIPKR